MQTSSPKGPLCGVLPKTLELFRENPPPDYMVWEGESKTKLRQLQAVFEDNIASSIDWSAIQRLGHIDSALSYCVDHPVMLEGVAVHILGITHSSDHSAEHVTQAIAGLNPGMICLESCVDRTQARASVQLPLIEKYNCDWPLITALDDPEGPSLQDLARHGLLDGSVELAQFMVASGSVQGCPELTGLFESKKRKIPLQSIDVLESVKMVQNAAIDSIGYSAKRQGDLSEGVLRKIVDEEGILSEYFRLLYGEAAMEGVKVQPSVLYRLIESRKRSPPYADLLLRELHRVYRGKQFWSRIFLRDIYMSLRVRRAIAGMAEPVLVIVGGAHVEGVRKILANPPEMPTHIALGLSVLLDNGESLCEAWRSILGQELFSCSVPKQIPNAELAAMKLVETILGSGHKISVWVNNGEWQVVDIGPKKSERTAQLAEFNVNGVGTMNLVKELVDGLVDPYTVIRLEAQSAVTING